MFWLVVPAAVLVAGAALEAVLEAAVLLEAGAEVLVAAAAVLELTSSALRLNNPAILPPLYLCCVLRVLKKRGLSKIGNHRCFLVWVSVRLGV